MKKRLLSMLLIVSMVLMMLSTLTFAASGPVNTWAALVAAVNAAPDGSQTVIEIGANLDANSQISILANKDIVIQSDSGNRIITRNASFSNSTLFNVNSSGKLILKNVTLDGNGSNVTATAGMVTIYSTGEFTMDGATIQNVKGNVVGAPVGVLIQSNSTMTMKNSSVINNVVNIAAFSAFYVAGTLNMVDSTVTGCTGDNCGGVGVYSGIFNMSGNSAITNNKGEFGSVTLSTGTFNLSGTPNISGNTKTNGTTPCNVFLGSSTRVINVTGTINNTTPVGVTSYTAVSAGSPAIITAVNNQDWSGYFTSDNPNYVIENTGSGSSQVLKLAVRSTINVSDSSGTNLPTGVTYAGNLFTIGSGANNSIITVTGNNSTSTNTIAVANNVIGLTLILKDVSITSPSGGNSPIDLQGNASVTIQLAGGTTNILDAKNADNKAGLCTNGTATVNINGTTGEINATGGLNGAGIGGAGVTDGDGGNIAIYGGTVAATGGSYGAGIGGAGSSGGDGGHISIYGGKVTATGGTGSAGIGSSTQADGGNISISGGTVIAGCSVNGGAGIGGGNTGGGGNITISGGTVTATGDWNAAGIGGGSGGSGGNISVSGGIVTAIGGAATAGGAGIGGGDGGSGGNITIGSSANITAVSMGDSRPAIDATSGSSGSVMNARLNSAISTTVASYLNCNGKVLVLPANYKCFALYAPSASELKVYSDSGCSALLGSIVTNPAGASSIPVIDLNSSPSTVTSVKFGAAYTATVTVNKDGSAWTAGTPGIQLSTLDTALQNAVTGSCIDNVYTFTGLASGKTYYVWDTTNNQYTEQNIINTSANATVNYYSLTVNLNGGNGTTANGSYISGKIFSIDAGTRTDYAFNGWTTSSGGTFANASSTSTTYTMPGNAATITANWKPVLTGSVNLSINAATGQVTASVSGGNTGTTGTLTYTWSGGATGTGTTATPTLGTPTSCTVTASGASGSIYATITVYKVTITKSGNTGTDNVSIANAYGKAGDIISMVYILDGSGTLSNTLTYSGVASNPAAVSVPGSATSSYTIASGDASSGTVALTATFSHSDTPTYALTINGGGTGVSGTGSYASGAAVPINAGTKSGYTFNGWTTSSGGTFANASSTSTTFTMPGNAATITANWTLSSSGGGGGSGGGSGGSTPTQTPTHVPVIVDGKDYYIGDVAVVDNTATITVDQSEFDKQLASAKKSVVVPVNSDAGTVVAQLVVKNVQDMNDKSVPLSVQTGNINYNIPASSIDTKAILSALGVTDPSLAPVNLIIRTNVDAATQTIVDSAVSATSVKEIIPAVQFEISANYNGKTYEIVNFDNFVSRSVEITQEQAQQITTAIVINPDRTIRHVPTFVYQKDGKWYAQINSRTNSTYVLIYNQMSFSDADGKWYQPVVNEMGSRKIISGVSNNCFAGDKAITRAEFAAILVRALGLPANGTSTFSDVPANAWYSGAVATAAQYGIVGGVGYNKFAPNDKITREQAMQMIYNASRLTSYAAVTGTDNIKSFTDYGTQSAWATDAVIFNINNGFIKGYNGLFNPKSNITRAETATVVLKLLQKSGLVDVRTKL